MKGRKAGRQEGRKAGRQEGRKAGRQEGRKQEAEKKAPQSVRGVKIVSDRQDSYRSVKLRSNTTPVVLSLSK